MPEIAPFTATPVADISRAAKEIRSTFASHKTRPVEFRLKQLRRLYWALKDNSALVEEACKKDLGKSSAEAHMTELGWCLNDVAFVAKKLKKWMKDEKPADVPLMNILQSPRIRKDPMGAVLVIGTYNFPFQLSISPLVGAIAAGCTAILKPSEMAPNAAMVIQKIVESALDPAAYKIVQGGVPEASALLDEKWDKIFYTGGAAVAKIISRKAAENLTPVTLELGGKNPAIVTKNANVHLAAKRLLWGKWLNSGQVCISQNYILIDESILTQFVNELKLAIKEFFPKGVKASEDYARIINLRQFQRLQQMLSDSKGEVLIDGEADEETLFMGPTVVKVTSPDDSLLRDESFGPIIPLLPIKDLDTAIRIANEVSGTPLGLYPFGTKAETDRMLREIRSGGATVNDAFFHGAIPTIPFGGVGESGTGSYRGRASFDCFSHHRTIAQTPGWMELFMGMRYPPFVGTSKMKQFGRMTDVKPNFGRV